MPRKLWLDNINDWTSLFTTTSTQDSTRWRRVMTKRPFVHTNDSFNQRIDADDDLQEAEERKTAEVLEE